MRISATYAGRSDLTQWEKARFTIEERIETSASVRKWYRHYFFLPKWIKGTIDFALVLSTAAPFIIAACCYWLGQKVAGDEETGERFGTVAYFLFTLVLSWFHWTGMLLVGLTAMTIFLLWFFCNVMYEYDRKIRKERRGEVA